MEIRLEKICESDVKQFKDDMQEAFQQGFEDNYGKTEGTILPEKDIDLSMAEKGAVAYKAVIDGEMVGGAVVVINGETQHNDLHLLYVKYGIQMGGIGFAMWQAIEKLHHETKVWETCTPYFERRNIHFYVNKCGFHIVEFRNEYNTPPEEREEDFIGDGGDGMFVLKKQM